MYTGCCRSRIERKLLNDYCNGNNSFDETEETTFASLERFLVRVFNKKTKRVLSNTF